jgi:hypothetical protein
VRTAHSPTLACSAGSSTSPAGPRSIAIASASLRYARAWGQPFHAASSSGWVELRSVMKYASQNARLPAGVAVVHSARAAVKSTSAAAR